MKTRECDIVIVGVGGQGVILLSNVIGISALMAKLPVRGVETHGMAQRGGSVMNHLRIGCELSPMIAAGSADILLAMEPAEALRFAHYLSKDGTAIVNTAPVHPITVTTGKSVYPPVAEILEVLKRACKNVLTLDATSLAAIAGSPQTMNMVMLGALSKYIPLEEGTLFEAISRSVPSRFLDVNRRAFELGKVEVE
jgi:indolepyruvate ferredoxin oxidoreductase beta subunit